MFVLENDGFPLNAPQEKMKGKNKLVPRLLGITKECVMRVEEKTKEVIQEWNLTNIKRWAASPKSFTLVSPRGGGGGGTCVVMQVA